MSKELRFDDMFQLVDGVAMPKSLRETTIPEIRDIIKRSKPCEGDSDNRFKLYAYKELMFIYYVSDVRSTFKRRGYSGDILINMAKEECKLPSSWKPDSVILKCIKMYVSTMETDEPGNKILATMLEGLRTSGDVISKIKGELDKKLTDSDTLLPQLTDITNSITALLKLSSSITDELNRINELKKRIAMSETKLRLAKGNIVVTSSMIPD